MSALVEVACPECGGSGKVTRPAGDDSGVTRMTEAREALPGGRTVNDMKEVVQTAVVEKLGPRGDNKWIWVRDLDDEMVIYELSGSGWGGQAGSYKATLTWDGNKVTIGEGKKVTAKTVYQTVESTDRIDGRLIEAKGTDEATGGRIFGVRIIAYGESKNRRRYPEAVMRKAVPLYEGAKAFDHHRTDEELRTSTIAGLIGTYRNVKATPEGIEADLVLLPSAKHTAEALDASLKAVADGLPPLVGLSHDVYGRYKAVTDGGKRLDEATEIVSVNSADVVADPAAGGRPTRMVAGGIGDNDPQEISVDLEKLLEAIAGASPEQKTALADALGVALAKPGTESNPPSPDPKTDDKPTTESGKGPASPDEPLYAKSSTLGRMLVTEAVKAAGIDPKVVESVLGGLPDRFTESDVARSVKTLTDPGMKQALERAGLLPSVPHEPQVVKEELDKKREAVEAMLSTSPADAGKGYTSLKQAYVDVTGADVRKYFALGSEDLSRRIWQESIGALTGRPYDAGRSTEAVDSSTWAQLFGDALHKRMIAEYRLLNLDDWRKIVSSIVTVTDFRDQKPQRMGGYGLLPVVPEKAPYQPLTTPGDEQVPWSVDKRGGTEEWTWESVRNDDLGAIQRIPRALGRAAAQTLYRFVFDFLATNPTMAYDATALFAAGHANTDAAAALSDATFKAAWARMAAQTAYGNPTEFLSPTPRFLIVPSALYPTAWDLTTSQVATVSNDSTRPNFARGTELIHVPYLTDANDWFLGADPMSTPTIEVGFLDGRQEPELFLQNDPTQGSLFDADVVKIKIRHVYGGTVLDHRGFYRGQG